MRKLLLFILSICSSFLSAQTPNENINLLSHISFGSATASNICGYADTAGREYALVGWEFGVKVIEVTNPANPIAITNVAGPQNLWREIKVNGHYAYITTEGGGGLKIADLANLPNPNIPVVNWTGPVGGYSIGGIHALHIDNDKVYLFDAKLNGFGYTIVADIHNPASPVYLATYFNPLSSYIHDGYVRNDTLYGAGSFISISKFDTIANQFSILSNNIYTPTNAAHNCWLNQTGTHLFTTDENANSFLTAFDVSNISNPSEVSRIQSQNPSTYSIVHNTHILKNSIGEFAVTAWYRDGVVITDVTRPTNLVNIGWYDTFTGVSGFGFEGCWGVYPFFPSGNLVASDISNGLFILQPNYIRACYFEGQVIDSITNLPINGADISIAISSTNNLNTKSKFTGDFATGYSSAGNYTVSVFKQGYMPQTFIVSLSNGIVNNKLIKLKPAQLVSITFNAFSNSNNMLISNANVKIQNAYGVLNAITNLSGNASINFLPTISDEFVVAKWGYKASCFSNFNASNNGSIINAYLDSAYEDDFSTNNNWMIQSTANSGKWIRDIPKGTTLSAVKLNPNKDLIDDCGQDAFVTGNNNASYLQDEVDSGYTRLISPKFVLLKSNSVTPYIQYSRWCVIRPPFMNDSFVVTLKNNNQSYILDVVSTVVSSGSWIRKTIDVSNYINNGDSLQLEVYVVDNNSNNIVEAGFDGFKAFDSLALSIAQIENQQPEIMVFPNPNNGEFDFDIIGNIQFPIQYSVMDCLGKMIKSGLLYSSKNHFNLNGCNGIYNLRLLSSNNSLIGAKRIAIQE